MIKIYYDRSLRLEAEKYQTFPLLQQLEKENSALDPAYQLVDTIESCDIGIVPMNIQYLFLLKKKKATMAFIDDCLKMGKEVLAFTGGDYGVSLNLRGVHTIRLGGFHSKMDPATYIMPPFIEDPYQKFKSDFTVISKSEKPTIGFVGHSNKSYSKFLKEFVLYVKGNLNRLIGLDFTDYQSFYPSGALRHNYLSLLEKDTQLNTDFTYRQQYRAGVRSESEKERTTKEFYQNIHDNIYTFCLRGTGNFSVRFYETLAMGRIPVVVNTNCRFPFSNKIDWDKHCVIVNEKQVRTLGERIVGFHKDHSEEMLHQIQRDNRKLWEDYFERDTYFKGIARILERK
jgi:uncharacterized protein YutD